MHFVVTREGSKWVRSSKYESRDVQDTFSTSRSCCSAEMNVKGKEGALKLQGKEW